MTKSDWVLAVFIVCATVWMVLAIDEKDRGCFVEYQKLEDESYSDKQIQEFREWCKMNSRHVSAEKLRIAYVNRHRPEWYKTWAKGQTEMTMKALDKALKRGIK